MHRDPVPIRLLTHNIRYATNSPFQGEELWPVRRPKINNQLNFNTAHNPEAFICLQEVLHQQIVDIRSLLNSTGEVWDYIGVGRDDGFASGEYSPIFYRPAVWRLLRYKTVWLSETPDQPSKGWDAASVRILTIGVFEHRQTTKELVAFNTHLDDQGSTSRLEAAKMIARQVDIWSKPVDRPRLPVFLAGDFNSEPEQDAYEYLTKQSPLQDIQTLIPSNLRYGHAATYTGFGHERLRPTRIDFLFIAADSKQHSEGEADVWEVCNYGILENRFDDGIYSSDHRAVVADMLLR